jgi:mono/diheme cytochrome c family protein
MKQCISFVFLFLVVLNAHAQLEHLEILDQELRGIALFDAFKCGACHGGVAHESAIPPKQAPDLAWASGRINPNYIEAFIADPLRVKPGTTMPNVLHELPAEERGEAATSITQYLMSLNHTPFETQPIDSEAGVRGRELFHSVGCAACHSPRDDRGNELLAETSEPLPDLGQKYNLDGLTAFLIDPHAVRSSGRMPNLRLTHWEALDIASYLLKLTESQEETQQEFKFNSDLVARGKQHFEQLNCVQCHEIDAISSREDFPPLTNTNLDQGCLSGDIGAWPIYDFSERHRDDIRTALTSDARELTDTQQINLALTTFNCTACHQRDGLGGIEPERDEYFLTANPNLGPSGRIPPTLTGVGAKLNPEWMSRVLGPGYAIRPYMNTRMPRFGSENVGHLVELFQRVDQLPDVEFAKFSDRSEIRKAGVALAGSDGLDCIVCHTFQQKPAQTMPAVDLTEMADRLKKSWFYHYMKDPQSLSPGTVMPTYWNGDEAILAMDELGDGANQEIEALWQYLLGGREARAPRGLVIEPMRLIAGANEAVMLRRKYEGIGKRGIGVGYPGRVNIVFDAEQMQLGMLWKGEFADPAPVWRGQGHGIVRPLGADRITFTRGPEFDDAESPWRVDEGRPPHHQFRGYYLDAKRRPTFMYRYSTIEVEDYFVDITDERSGVTHFQRTLTFTANHPRARIAFRAATTEGTIAKTGDHVYEIDGALRIRVDSTYRAQIMDTEAGKQLRIPLDLPVGKSTLILEYDW